MIGLKRGSVKLVPHKKSWQGSFEKVKQHIEQVLDEHVLDIEHIGSTAIPSVSAKPIIDIAVGVETMNSADKIIDLMESAGYEWRDNFEQKNTQLFFVKGIESKRTHYIHVMKYNGTVWKNHIHFRDYLLDNEKVAKEYDRLKKQLAGKYSNNREKYTQGKKQFILKVLETVS